ncbi:MAG: hypothetical protein Fur0022_36830 [Anaerolineales bacterium]
MIRFKYLLPLILLILAALACARQGNSVPPSATVLPTGTLTRTLTHDTRERSYLLYVPSSIDWTQPVAVVFVFHGGTGNAEISARMSGFNAVADNNGFLVVYPNGTGRLSDEKILTWNGGTCCGYAQQQNVDDVGFVRAIVADLQTLITVDPNRIYATGMSNGGILSHRLGCEAADLFAAIAPVAGTLNVSPCTPSEPVAVIEFHGTDDQNLPYEGGVGPDSLVGVNFASVADSLKVWTITNGCDATPQMETFDDIKHETWTGCAAPVELYTIIGGGHAWPGGERGHPDADTPSQTINASELIWAFFAAHPKPSLDSNTP